MIIAVVIVVAALAIILPIVLIKSPNVDPGPHPTPGPPIPPEPIFYNETTYNPYFSVDVANEEFEIRGLLYTKDPYRPE